MWILFTGENLRAFIAHKLITSIKCYKKKSKFRSGFIFVDNIFHDTHGFLNVTSAILSKFK